MSYQSGNRIERPYILQIEIISMNNYSSNDGIIIAINDMS